MDLGSEKDGKRLRERDGDRETLPGPPRSCPCSAVSEQKIRTLVKPFEKRTNHLTSDQNLCLVIKPFDR